jgi:hypothetical protein
MQAFLGAAENATDYEGGRKIVMESLGEGAIRTYVTILSRLRQHFPHTPSFLTDRDTLVNHRDFSTEELSGTRVLRDLPALDPYEQSLYDDLRNDRLGDRVRLEQERVQYQLVEQAVLALHC